MHHIGKKILSVFFVLLLMLTVIPITASATSGDDIVAYARQYIGCAYVHGTHGPNTFDCSGFVHYVFAHFGIDLPLSSSSYFNNPTAYGTVVGTGSTANAKAGDLISWSGHVAIYTSNGHCVEALNARYGVTESIAVNSHTNGMNYKVIRVYGIGKDTQAPTISDAYASEITKDSFKISCSLSDNTGVTSVKLAIQGPKKSNTKTVKISDGSFSYTIQTADFGGAGLYSVTIYAYDDAGNEGVREIRNILVPNHTHAYISKVTKKATCSSEGVRTYTCLCGDSYTESIPKKAHTEGEWVVTKQPTTSKTGTRTLYCSVCGEVIRTESIPKLSTTAKVKSVSVDDVTVNCKKTVTLSPEIEAESGASYTVRYASADTSIATVDADGVVTGVKQGSTTITVTVKDATGNSVIGTCTVKVKYTALQMVLRILSFRFLWA